jgi:hypothetical protein
VADGIPARLKVVEARKFGLAVGAVFLGLAGLLWWRGRASSPLVFGALGIALILLGALIPAALVPVRRMWMGIAEGISKVTTPIFMGIVYFGILTPIGLGRRLFGHSPVKRPSDGESLWIVREARERKPEDMEHQF